MFLYGTKREYQNRLLPFIGIGSKNGELYRGRVLDQQSSAASPHPFILFAVRSYKASIVVKINKTFTIHHTLHGPCNWNHRSLTERISKRSRPEPPHLHSYQICPSLLSYVTELLSADFQHWLRVQQRGVVSSQCSSVCLRNPPGESPALPHCQRGQLWPKHVLATQVLGGALGDCCLTHGWHNTVSDGGCSSTHTYVAERLRHTAFLIPNLPLSSTHSYLFAFLSLFLRPFQLLSLVDTLYTLFTSPPVWCLYVSLLSKLSVAFPPSSLHFSSLLSFALSGWSATPAWASVWVCVTASQLPSKHPVNEC